MCARVWKYIYRVDTEIDEVVVVDVVWILLYAMTRVYI